MKPVTDEEFQRIAAEEGVPLSAAYGIWNNESRMGMDASALIDPRLRAGKNKMNPDYKKIGYGSMQVIEDTYNSVMPKGSDYFSATDADLTRAGMRVLKKAINSDGSVDYQKMKNLYFGRGGDKSFGGLKTATNSEIDTKLRRVIYAVENPSDPNMTPREAINAALKNPEAPLADPAQIRSKSVSQIKVDTAKAEGDFLANYDSAAAQAKYDEAAEAKRKQLEEIQKAERLGQARVGDTFGVNPYGVFAEGERIAEELKAANARAERATKGYNFELTPSQGGIMGVLETFAARMDGRINGERYDKQAKAAADRAKDYAAIVNNFAVNAARMSPNSLSEQLQIDTAARAAGTDTTTFDKQALLQEQRSRQLSNQEARTAQAQDRLEFSQRLAEANTRTKEAQAEAKRIESAARLEVAQRKIDTDADIALTKIAAASSSDPAAKQQARVILTRKFQSRIPILEQQLAEAKSAGNTAQVLFYEKQLGDARASLEGYSSYGTDDMDVLSAAASKLANTPDKKVWSLAEIKTFIGSDKTKQRQFQDLITSGGDTSVLRNPDVQSNLLTMRSQGTLEQRVAADKIDAFFAQKTDEALPGLIGITAPGAIATPQNILAARNKLEGASPKQREQYIALAQARAKIELSSAVTPETSMEANPLNVNSLATWVQSSGIPGGLAKTIEDAKIDISQVQGDAELISKLLVRQKDGTLEITPTQLKNQLHSYYTQLARDRAGPKSIPYELNIPVPADKYIISTQDNKLFDLTKSADLLRYIDRVQRGVDAAARSAKSWNVGVQALN